MKLGQPVKASAYLIRRAVPKPGRGWGVSGREWQRSTYPEPRTGVLVGLRTVSDGDRVNLGDDGIAYRATSHHRVALVAFDLNRTPRLVALDDLTAVPPAVAAVKAKAAKQVQP